MTDKLELKSCHEVIDTVSVADVDSIFQGKPTDPDILTVVMKGGRRLYCDEVCPVDSLQEEPVAPKVLEDMLNAKTAAESLGISAEEHEKIIDLCLYGEKPVSDDLEQASEEYAYKNWQSDDYHEGASEGLEFDPIGHTQKTFKAGAKWQKEQMMKEAVDGQVVKAYTGLFRFSSEEISNDDIKKMNLKFGDKVKLIII